MADLNKVYVRVSGFYFFYFATLGALVPYWGLYLQSIGFTPVDIGKLVAVLMFSRIVAPLVWGWIADRRENQMNAVRLASLLTIVAFTGVFFGTTFWWLAAVMLFFSFFWHASLPLLEVAVMRYTASRPGAYGRVRLWGSIGFIVAVTALGTLIDARATLDAQPAARNAAHPAALAPPCRRPKARLANTIRRLRLTSPRQISPPRAPPFS